MSTWTLYLNYAQDPGALLLLAGALWLLQRVVHAVDGVVCAVAAWRRRRADDALAEVYEIHTGYRPGPVPSHAARAAS